MEVLKHQNFNKWLKSGLKQTKDQPLHNAVNLKACSFMVNDSIKTYIKGTGINGNLGGEYRKCPWGGSIKVGGVSSSDFPQSWCYNPPEFQATDLQLLVHIGLSPQVLGLDLAQMQVSVLRLHMGPVETALLLWVVSLLSIQLETQTFQPAQAFCVSWSSSLSSSLDLFTGVPFKSTSVLTGALYFVLIFCRA